MHFKITFVYKVPVGHGIYFEVRSTVRQQIQINTLIILFYKAKLPANTNEGERTDNGLARRTMKRKRLQWSMKKHCKVTVNIHTSAECVCNSGCLCRLKVRQKLRRAESRCWFSCSMRNQSATEYQRAWHTWKLSAAAPSLPTLLCFALLSWISAMFFRNWLWYIFQFSSHLITPKSNPVGHEVGGTQRTPQKCKNALLPKSYNNKQHRNQSNNIL